MNKTLAQKDVNLVKVGNREYYVYTYRGKLKDIPDCMIALCWPKEALFKEGCLRAFITLDTTLTTEELLNHYKNRWPIETFFRETKKHLGLNDYQVRSSLSIRRYFILLMLTYTYCGMIVRNDRLSFGTGIKKVRNQVIREQVTWIFSQSRGGCTLDEVLKVLKIA